MGILGIGTDIIEISRIANIVSKTGDRLARRVLSNNEWIIWKANYQSVRFLAKRFTVKEAIAKAFGTGIRNGLAFKQFEVLHDNLGKIYIHLFGYAFILANKLGVKHVHATLADERKYAYATVIIEN